MYPSIVAIIIPILAASVQASRVDGPCTGSYSYGICETIDTCNYYGGKHTAGYCPGTPTDVECCYNIENCVPSNGGEKSSSCSWTTEMCGSTSHTGTWVSKTGKCPGGSNFECCAISRE